MKLAMRAAAVAAVLAFLASPVSAGLNSNAKIFAHLGPVVAKNVCLEPPSNCRDAVVSGNPMNFYHAYLCVGNHSDSIGVAGVQFGIQYNDAPGAGVDVFSWNRCADLEFAMPTYPSANNSGNVVTWGRVNNCQLGTATTVAGYLYIGVYSPDRLSIVPHPIDGAAKVADCESVEEDLTGQSPSALGFVDFGTGQGYNPCSTIVPVEEATWSGVKSLFR